MTEPPRDASPDCAPFREDLVALEDGELDPARAAAVEAHLAACAPCAAERRALALAWSDLGALPALVAGPDLLGRIETHVLAADVPALRVVEGGGGRSRAGGRALRRWLAAAAAALLAAGAGFLFIGPRLRDVAVNVDRPAPPAPTPTQATPTTPVTPATPTTPGTEVSPASPTQAGPEGPPAPPDPLQGLSAEERDLVTNLDVLKDLEELEALGLLDAADEFDDMAPEELDEG
jgi:anti-sigma factor RsiW